MIFDDQSPHATEALDPLFDVSYLAVAPGWHEENCQRNRLKGVSVNGDVSEFHAFLWVGPEARPFFKVTSPPCKQPFPIPEELSAVSAGHLARVT